MNVTEGILILATIAGPVLAVQAQKWLERIREARKRRLNLFFQLMATRASRLSHEHVRALNMIDIEFYGDDKYRSVIDAWRIYHDHLNDQTVTDAQISSWVNRGADLFVDLLYAMSRALGYNFDKVQLKRGSYSPRAHSDNEAAQIGIRDSLAAILNGTKPFPVAITSVTPPPEVQPDRARNAEIGEG